MGTAVLVIVIMVMLLGLAGILLPIVPAIPLIFAAIAAYGWYEHFQVITPSFLTVMAGLTILSLFVDYLATYLGAKFFNSSRKGIWGAVLGSIVGIFIIPPLGIFICPWIGAVLGELLEGNNFQKAMRSGMGAVIGLFSGMAFKGILGAGMIISFLIKVF